ncbi:MAG: D-alanyl-D-alanine carboxypeptidase [Clostridia bacterium]|nr:D-alanyl-D-alanine carboxypeptidase [Clostridia bacterium]
MKKYLSVSAAAIAACCMVVSGGGTLSVRARAEEKLPCKAAYLCDFESGTKVFSENEEKRLPIASMCKIMTLLLSLEAVDRGELSFDEQITISENAAGMGGSQVFLDTGLSYKAEDLMRTIAVCSANDSCVALAERVAGSESAFIERMNTRAKELGADNTLFANCTGLPKEPQYSCARDVSVMLRELLKHQKYYEFSKVWLEDFAHPDGRTTTITNTNKLIRSYVGCDGGKTGFTNEAGFCLAATAKRGDTRIVSVVIGADSSKSRNKTVTELFDFAFNTYETKPVLEAGQTVGKTMVKGSKVKEVELIAEGSLSAFSKKGDDSGLNVEYRYPEEVSAPLCAGTVLGEAVLYRDGVEVARTNLKAKCDAMRYTWWDSFREGARNWN